MPSAKRKILPAERVHVAAFGDYAPGILGKCLGLRQQFEPFDNLRIGFRPNLQAFFLAESIYENLTLDARTDEVSVLQQVRLGVRDLFLIKELTEILHHRIIDLEFLRVGAVIHNVALGEIEEDVMLKQRILETVAFNRRNLDVRTNAATTINRATAVRELDLVRVVVLFRLAVEIVVVERDIRIIALNQTSAGRVVFGGGQSQACVLRKRIDRLHEPFAEGGFAGYQSAVMILNGAGNNFLRRSRAAIDKHN